MSRLTADEVVAAYLLDRADQYDPESACWVALADACHNVLLGEHRRSHAEGEFDASLIARVRKIKRTEQAIAVRPRAGIDRGDQTEET